MIDVLLASGDIYYSIGDIHFATFYKRHSTSDIDILTGDTGDLWHRYYQKMSPIKVSTQTDGHQNPDKRAKFFKAMR